MLDSFGNLTVRAYTAGGGLPVPGVSVRIKGAEELNKEIYHEFLTDKDGNTPTVNLPAPGKSLSLSPSPPEKPYALYDIEIDKEGYYSKKIYGITVFSDINTLQLINMIPISDGGLTEFPRSGLNTVIPENPNL